MMQSRRILFFSNHATFFASHRLHIASLLIKNGYDVYLVHGRNKNNNLEAKAKNEIVSKGVILFEASFRPDISNLITEITGFIQSARYIKMIKPDIIHTISPKGLVLGGLLANLLSIPHLVISISGMGSIFTFGKKGFQSRLKKFLKLFIQKCISFILKHKSIEVIVQNNYDRKYFQNSYSLKHSVISLIRGSGVEQSLYRNVDFNEKENIVLMVARLISTKGVKDYYNVTKDLAEKYSDWRFIIAGDIDKNNPDSISKETIDLWRKNSDVEFLGHLDEIHDLFKRSKIFCLPSYREGFPKTIMEASISGNATVTYDSIGCREAVINNETGIIVKIGNINALEKAIITLIEDNHMREILGRKALKYANENFTQEVVATKHLKIYKKLLND